MSLLNLGLFEFLAIFSGITAGVVALYLLDRTRRRLTVPSLRFWSSVQRTPQTQHRRRFDQPWSLLLQLLSILLLLLAAAQLRWGFGPGHARDHVLVMDTSAWMGARVRDRSLMDEARVNALAWLRTVPSGDRVMLMHADTVATPVTAFETDRRAISNAIQQAQPQSSALVLSRAFIQARQAQSQHSGSPGQIVFAGAGRVPPEDLASVAPPSNLRILPVAAVRDNCGLKKVGLRRSAVDPSLWDVFVSVRNYGATAKRVPLVMTFGGAPAGSRELIVAPRSEAGTNFEFRTKAGGWLEARLLLKDAFEGDDRVTVELPALVNLKVTVYSAEPEVLRPVLVANRRVEAAFRAPGEVNPSDGAQIVILDRFKPQTPLKVNSIWIEPPAGSSPIAVRATRQHAPLTAWRSDYPLAAGLHGKDLRLESAQILSPAPGDIPIAEVAEGPVILARPSQPKVVVLGFHPGRSASRYELATPLLFANLLRWMAPEVFLRWELQASSVGTVDVPLETGDDVSRAKVVNNREQPLPFTVHDRTLRFFCGKPGVVRVDLGDRELVYSLTLPEMAEASWEPPASTPRGVPGGVAATVGAAELWPWLAAAGAFGLALEWLLFGRRRERARMSPFASAAAAWRKAS